eukprot:SAG25_NODE_945_length_4647_cov_2.700528_2_plen_102_part_00
MIRPTATWASPMPQPLVPHDDVRFPGTERRYLGSWVLRCQRRVNMRARYALRRAVSFCHVAEVGGNVDVLRKQEVFQLLPFLAAVAVILVLRTIFVRPYKM